MVTTNNCDSKHRNLSRVITSIFLVLSIISGFVLAATKNAGDAKQKVNDFNIEVTKDIHDIVNKFDIHAAAQEKTDEYIVESLDRLQTSVDNL